MPAWSAGCEREIVSLSASVSRESASKVIGRAREQVGLGARPAAPPRARRRPPRGRSGRAACAGRHRLRATGARWQNSARQLVDRARSGTAPRPASALPKPWRLRWIAAPRRRVVGAREVVELDRDRRLVSAGNTWPSRAVAGGGAARHLQVLQAQRRARADRERGVHRQLVARRRRADVDLRARPAVGQRTRADSARTRPGCRPRAPRRPRPRPPRSRPAPSRPAWDERQPAVRVVGEEDRDTATSTVTGPTRAGLATMDVRGRRVMARGGSRGAVARLPRAGFGRRAGQRVEEAVEQRAVPPASGADGGVPAGGVRRGGPLARGRRRLPRLPVARPRLAACASPSAAAVGSGAVTPGWFGPSQAAAVVLVLLARRLGVRVRRAVVGVHGRAHHVAELVEAVDGRATG